MGHLHFNSKISDTVFCALDFETTGINAAFHKIVEIGMVKFTVDGIIEEYETLVNPQEHIPWAATQVHGITNEMVSSCKPISSIIKEIESFLKGCILVIQNPGFDFSFLARAFYDNNIKLNQMYAIDTVRISKKAFPKLVNHKLNTVSTHIGFDFKHHRALPDAYACMQIFLSSLDVFDPEKKFTIANFVSIHGKLIKPKPVSIIPQKIEEVNGIKIGVPVTIKYKDAEGSISEREIIPYSIVNEGSMAYILAHCKLRNGERMFKINRIAEIVGGF